MQNILKENRLLGAILLIAGCCIGAGMLGLPLVTAATGFFPTIGLFLLSWLFMLSTGLLLLEVTLSMEPGVNLMTLSERLLGGKARIIVGLLFAFLFYCLMVAYLSGGGTLISEILAYTTSFSIEPITGSITLVLLFGITLFLGAHTTDLLNRLLMVGLALSYFGLVIMGIQHVDIKKLSYCALNCALPALPAMIISFGFHNLIPTLTEYLNRDVKLLRLSIIIGSTIPLFVYLLWDLVILGILPIGGKLQEGVMITTLLKEAVGSSLVLDFLRGFAFFSLVTSFLAVALSFVDFIGDGLHLKKISSGRINAILIVLLPPLLFSFLYPSLFLTALNYAGAFGAVILFGVIPVIMAWKKRYTLHNHQHILVPGGKAVLCLLLLFSMGVFLMQLKIELGV